MEKAQSSDLNRGHNVIRDGLMHGDGVFCSLLQNMIGRRVIEGILALINGTNKNRYIKCEYVADKNQLPSCSIVEGVDDEIKKVSQSYFAENEEVVRKSVVSNSLKFLLKSGMV